MTTWLGAISRWFVNSDTILVESLYNRFGYTSFANGTKSP